MERKDWIFILCLIFVGIISVIGLTLSLSDINCNFLQFSPDKLSNIISACVGSVALVITVYLAILAISAFSHIKDIEKTRKDIDESKSSIDQTKNNIQTFNGEIITKKEEIEACLNTTKITRDSINNTYNQIKSFLQDYANTFYDEIDHFIGLADGDKNIKHRDYLRTKQARMAYRYPMLDLDKRIDLLFKLAYVGEKEDIEPLMILVKNEENIDLKAAGELALEELRKKYIVYVNVAQPVIAGII